MVTFVSSRSARVLCAVAFMVGALGVGTSFPLATKSSFAGAAATSQPATAPAAPLVLEIALVVDAPELTLKLTATNITAEVLMIPMFHRIGNAVEVVNPAGKVIGGGTSVSVIGGGQPARLGLKPSETMSWDFKPAYLMTAAGKYKLRWRVNDSTSPDLTFVRNAAEK